MRVSCSLHGTWSTWDIHRMVLVRLFVCLSHSFCVALSSTLTCTFVDVVCSIYIPSTTLPPFLLRTSPHHSSSLTCRLYVWVWDLRAVVVISRRCAYGPTHPISTTNSHLYPLILYVIISLSHLFFFLLQSIIFFLPAALLSKSKFPRLAFRICLLMAFVHLLPKKYNI